MQRLLAHLTKLTLRHNTASFWGEWVTDLAKAQVQVTTHTDK